MFSSNLNIFFNATKVNSPPKPNDYIFIYQNNKILVVNNLEVPTLEELTNLNLKNFTYLFSFSDKNVYLSKDDNSIAYDKYSSHGLRDFLYLPEHTQPAIVFTAYHLMVWYNNNKFCGKCGSPFAHSKTERALECPSCKHLLYPTISPVVIVGIYSNDQLLLTKYARGAYKNYALVAGFVEIGETLEQCVEREVLEEVGLHIKNIKYMGSQPWGITQTLIAGFYAEVDGDTTVTLEDQELKEATWFKREDLPRNNEGNASITWELIYNFRDNIDFFNTFNTK